MRRRPRWHWHCTWPLLMRPVAMLVVGGSLAHLVACYQPALRDCTVRCSGSADCAAGQRCRDDGWCAQPSVTSCSDGIAVTSDAAPLRPDAPAPDDPCVQGCTDGTCVNRVCVIDCSAPGSCASDVVCPVNLPCRVVCGDFACSHKILCNEASACTVECIGERACGDEIQCNAETCRVTCSGTESCEKRTRCANACRCDVTCSGAGSCWEASECSSSGCRVGNGCTSAMPGCADTCDG